jgi:hypothetical protein
MERRQFNLFRVTLPRKEVVCVVGILEGEKTYIQNPQMDLNITIKTLKIGEGKLSPKFLSKQPNHRFWLIGTLYDTSSYKQRLI